MTAPAQQQVSAQYRFPIDESRVPTGEHWLTLRVLYQQPNDVGTDRGFQAAFFNETVTVFEDVEEFNAASFFIGMIILALFVLGMYALYLAYGWFMNNSSLVVGPDATFGGQGAKKGVAIDSAPIEHANVDDWASSMLTVPKKKKKGGKKKTQ